MNPIAWLQARMWQVGAIGAGVVALALGGALIVANIQKAGVERERDALFDAIHNESTGYVVRLNQCRANTATLEGSIEDQNARIQDLHDESEARLAEARAQVDAARRQTAAAQERVNRFLARGPEGATECERFEDVDRRFEDMLK